jgi:crotonobetainyl-CoA:carnitine CoA-transferase CaiB-like acyl-CoA transferase
MKDTLLLRSCQLGIAVGGILLILSGYGIHTGWLRLPAFATLVGAVAGLCYESRRTRRGEGEGIQALMLPVAGVVSGIFALVANV